MCLEVVHTKWILTWRSKQPVDGAWPYSTNAQTDKHSAQCLVCFLRAAGGNVSRGPWLGEAGCPGFLRSSLALRSVFSVLHFLSQGHKRHTLPSDFLAFTPAPIQEVTESLMCRQNWLSEAKAALDHILIRIYCMKMMDDLILSFPSTPQHSSIMNQHGKSCALNIAQLLPSGLVCLKCKAIFISCFLP